jgi:hypothetical protein
MQTSMKTIKLKNSKYEFFHFYYWEKKYHMWQFKFYRWSDEISIHIDPLQFVWTELPF